MAPAADAIGDGTPRRSGPCFAGELFPEEKPAPARRAKHSLATPVVTMTGTIDLARDLLPAVEDAMTHEIPVITEQHWIPPQATPARSPEPSRVLELAGWVANPENADASEGTGWQVAEPAIGTPAEGFHRSLSWVGPIGAVVEDERGDLVSHVPTRRADEPATLETPVLSANPELADESDQPEGIVALWEGALGRAATPEAAEVVTSEVAYPLVSPETVDLTSGRLYGPAFTVHTVPRSVTGWALATAPLPHQARQHEFVPLQVPGEYQEKAHEVPNLSELVLLDGARLPSAIAPSGAVETSKPTLGDLGTADGGPVTIPNISRIAHALEGKRVSTTPSVRPDDAPTLPSMPVVPGAAPIPMLPSFSTDPLRSHVTVVTVDELTAAVPELRLLTKNPFQQTPAAHDRSDAAMALPVLGGSRLGDAPNIAALHGETMPMPAVRV